MRVLIVSQYFWPEEFRINDVAEDMVSRGHDVVVLTGWPNYPSGSVSSQFLADRRKFDSYKGAAIIRAPLIPRGNGRAAKLILNYLSFAFTAAWKGIGLSRGPKFDAILVFQTSPITAAFPALLVGWLTRRPVLLWIQDLWPESLAAVGAVKSNAILKAVKLMVGFIYRRCDHILIQSRAFRDNVLNNAKAERPIDYLPNWTDLPVTGKASAPAPELSDYASTFNLMFAGNLGDAQDLPTLVEAANLCRDIENLRWLMVGEGRAGAAMKAEVARCGLEDRVIFLGRHPSSRMSEFFAGADGLIVSLKREPIFALTLPSKVQAYLAAGRPILAMLEGEGGRVVDESGAGWVSPPGDASQFALNVRRLVATSAGERSRMGEAGREYCQAHFDRSALITRLEGFLSRAGQR